MKKSCRTLIKGLLVTFLLVIIGMVATKGTAYAATNSTINFQARLETSTGSIVPDGNYSVEFKIYDASSSSGSSQGSCSGDADCLWVETRTGANTVRVADGYLTVNLGSVNAFPSTMPWDQQLWLTMNIYNGSSWDGEMSPRIQLTGIPYAFKAAAAFSIQNSSGTTLLSTSGSQVNLQNATSAATALTFDSDSSADLYRSASGTIKTDGNFTAGGNLSVTGTSTLTGNVSVTDNVTVGGIIGFSNTGNANQALTINENITGSVTAGDVVVIDTANAGYVKDSSSANSTQVVGIATATQTGGSEPIVVSGVYQVNVGSNSINVGDYLVTDSNSGEATDTTSPSGGIVGQAMSTASSNKAWALIKPQSGAGGGSGGTVTVPSVHAYATSTTSLATSTWTTIPLGGETFDTNNMHSVSSNTSRITFNTAGTYTLTASVDFSESGSGAGLGRRMYQLIKNGSTAVAFGVAKAGSSGDTIPTLAVTAQFSAGDYVELQAFQDSGYTMSVASGDPGTSVSAVQEDFGFATTGIQNGTTTQTANFNIQSASASNPTAVIKGAASQSADVMDVQNSSGVNLLSVDPNGNTFVAGNLNVGGTIGFSNIGNANQGLTVNEVVTSSVTAGDVVVIDTINQGQVTDSTSANSTQVFGVATQTNSAGVSQPIVISGIYQVNVDSNVVHVGDYLVTSNTTGVATATSSPSGGVIGQALSYKAGGSSGTVWARINPGNGAGGTGGSSSPSYGLMESDFVDTGATLPGLLDASATATIGNYIYLFGGYNGSSTTNVIYRAPVSNPTSWTNMSLAANGSYTLPGDLYNSQLAIIGSKIYLFGGYNDSTYTNVIYSADVSDPLTWSSAGTISPATNGLGDSQIAVIGSYVYLFGGETSSGPINTIFSAPISNPTSWSSAGTVAPEASGLYASQLAVIGNYIYMFGGYTTASQNTILRAPVSNPTSWTLMSATLPGALYLSNFVIVGNYMYLISGANSGYLTVIYRAPVNDPLSWSDTNQTIPTPAAISSLAIVGSALYLFGGHGTSNTIEQTIYSAPIYNGGPDLSSNPSWKVDSNVSSGGGGGSGTSSQTANNNYQLDYQQITSPVTGIGNSAVNVITGNAVTYSGAPVDVEFFAPYASATSGANSGNNIFICLYRDSSSIGCASSGEYNTSSVSPFGSVVRMDIFDTPSAGSHTYSAKAYDTLSGSSSGAVYAGTGGSGYAPAYIRVTLANPSLQGSSSGINNGTVTQTANFNVQSASASNPTAVIQGAASQSADILDVKDGSGNIAFSVGPTDNAYVKGNLGIATTSPSFDSTFFNGAASGSQVIDLYNSSWAANADEQIRVGDLLLNSRKGGSNNIISDTARGSNGNLSIGTASYANQLFILNSNGNLGIGTTNPQAALHVNSSTALSSFTGTAFGSTLIQGPNTNNDYVSTIDFSQYNSEPTARIGEKITSSGSYLNFGTSNNWSSGITNTALTIDPNGNTEINGNALYNYKSTCTSWPADLNSATASGYLYGCTNGSPTNAPGGGSLNGFLYFVGDPTTVGVQYYFAYGGTEYHRTLWYGTWYSWTSP